MLENISIRLETTIHDVTGIVNCKTATIPCRVECDESQLAIIKEACEREAHCQEGHAEFKRVVRRRDKWRKRFPNVNRQTLALLIIKEEELVFDCLSKVPFNLLTEREIVQLRIRRFVLSDRVLVEDRGETVTPLYWAINAPNAGLANINPPPHSQAKFLKSIAIIREHKELERLRKVWNELGLPQIKTRIKLRDLRQILNAIGQATGKRMAGI